MVDKEQLYEHYLLVLDSLSDTRQALNYTNLFLDLLPDHPSALGKKMSLEQIINESRVLNHDGSSGKSNTSCIVQ